MTKKYDLGKIKSEEIADLSELVIKSLKKDNIYREDFLYRGICGNESKYDLILKYGTDRTEKRGGVKMFSSPNLMWAVSEDNLGSVTNVYSIPMFPAIKDNFSFILVYKKEFFNPYTKNFKKQTKDNMFPGLSEKDIGVHEIKKNKKMKDALAALFKFKIEWD